MNFEGLKISKVRPPTYLFDISREEDYVTLVHKKHDPHEDHEDENGDVDVYSPKSHNCSANTTLDLTGNPLHVDLKGDDDLGDTSHFIKRPDNWMHQEMHHYPMDLPTARNVLNMLSITAKSEENGESFEDATMYCVCNAKDSWKTILLGFDPVTNKRVLINIKGFFPETHDEMKIETMLSKHEKNCGELCEVLCRVSALYSISGWDLKNCTVSDLSAESRSALLETSWNKPIYGPCNTNDIHLRLQIFAGQIDSQFYIFWEQLSLIQSCIDIIHNNLDLDGVQISSNPMDDLEISDRLSNLLIQQPSRSMLKKKTVNFKDLDMNNLRDEDFMDQFWRLLINCEKVDAIRYCFITIFEEFAQNTVIKYVPDDNNSTIANILRGILDGTLAVPTITLSQSLLFLIELGIQKLKNDYLYIIKSLNTFEHQEILKEWNIISCNLKKIDTRVPLSNAKRVTAARKTRMTIAKGTMNLELSGISKLLNCLTGLHISIEFLEVAKNSNLPEMTFEQVTKNVFVKYRPANSAIKFRELQNNRFCEIDIPMYDITTEYLKGLNTLFWNLKMTSQEGDSTVTTIFHHSEIPIIPSVIFKDWEIPSERKEKHFYVHEAIILTN